MAGRPGYLLSPHWPRWSEALGFMGWGKEDSRGRTGWLHSPHLISERLQELTTHLRPVFDFREGVRKWLPCKHISGVWAQGTPPKSNTGPVSCLLTQLPGEEGSFSPFDLGRTKLLNCIIKYCLFCDDSQSFTSGY